MESKQHRNFAVLSRRDTRQRLKREKKKERTKIWQNVRGISNSIYLLCLGNLSVSGGRVAVSLWWETNENGRGMQFAIPRPYYSKTLSLFYSTVDNPRLSLMFRSFPLIFFFLSSFIAFSFSFRFSLAPPWLVPAINLRLIDNLLRQFFSSNPSLQSCWRSHSQVFGMHLPGLHSNSVSLHCFDPFDRNRFIIFHSRNHSFARPVAVRARTEANKSETNLANNLSAHTNLLVAILNWDRANLFPSRVTTFWEG